MRQRLLRRIILEKRRPQGWWAGCHERRQFVDMPSAMLGTDPAETDQACADAVGHSSLLLRN